MRLVRVLLFGAAVAAAIVALSGASTTRVFYGDECTGARKCEKREWLTCNKTGICDCMKPDIMIYESYSEEPSVLALLGSAKKGKCAIKIGERCRFSLGLHHQDGMSVFETFPCVSNSACDRDGFCACKSKFYENLNGTCTKFQDHLQKCDDNLKCKAQFNCARNQCVCDSLTSAYDSQLGKCRGLPGRPCNSSDFCVENASCEGNRCECMSEYFINDQGTCSPQGHFGEACGKDEECRFDKNAGTRLKCLNGKCNCNPEASIYSRANDRCVSLVGQACPMGWCVENAYCNGRLCVCMSSHYITDQGTCELPMVYGQACTRDDQCGKDQVTNLPFKCVKNKCNCDPTTSAFGSVQPSSQNREDYEIARAFYGFESYAEVRACAPKADQTCVNRYCAPGAFCLYDNSYNPHGTCQCLPGTIKSKLDGMCGKPLGSPCKNRTECMEPLSCRAGRCGCLSNQEYNQLTAKCDTKVRGPCTRDNECGKCAECKRIKETHPAGHCACSDGCTVDGAQGCKGLFNSTCAFNGKECAAVAGLECIDEHCACPGSSVFSTELQKCVGLVGAPCKYLDKVCTPNANCKWTTYLHSDGILEKVGHCACDAGFVEKEDYRCEVEVLTATDGNGEEWTTGSASAEKDAYGNGDIMSPTPTLETVYTTPEGMDLMNTSG